MVIIWQDQLQRLNEDFLLKGAAHSNFPNPEEGGNYRTRAINNRSFSNLFHLESSFFKAKKKILNTQKVFPEFKPRLLMA